ncbi:MAG: 2-oxoacid:acceptor oxidoreductase subunit alpha, partial [Myxococcota bacterium]|nr:2-oxoacid:acceptor oxidoreductase subunit alpha [Myxococcota bacterium]
MVSKSQTQVENVIIRFAGDSGDGMQLTGTQFTTTTALYGNDIATFPDYPAEIRAPAGTLGGVSGFQLHFSSSEIRTPGDAPTVLVAMNAAALKKNLKDMAPGTMIIVNTDKFQAIDLRNADYENNPLEDESLSEYQVIPVKLSSMTAAAVKEQGLNRKEADRCKNFFALGITYWLFNRSKEKTIAWVRSKFKGDKQKYADANINALEAGWSFAETMELLPSSYEVAPAKLRPGVYRNISGNQALALGFVTASSLANRPLFLGAYPITPASDLLHNLSKYKEHGVITFQAEDEIAAISSAIGASFGGHIGITSSSGPGIALKGEAIGLATITELPLVVVDIQRGGPSTGLPTKTEQSDFNIAIYGRHGESPIPVLAAKSPSDCFHAGIEAVRAAIKYRMPIMLLTDGYIANGSEPWRLPDPEELTPIECNFATETEGFAPYKRDPETLARPWAIPGTPGLEHRIGGLEKADLTGNVSYDPENHEKMSLIREEKVKRILADIPDLEVHGKADGVLCVSWGGTFG